MFGRRRKTKVDGQTCPLCQLVSPDEAENCSRCYYEFTVAAHRQTVSELTEVESDGLFDALMKEDADSDEETPQVDWTSHSFSMDDMTVEVSQYGEDGFVEVDQSVSMEHQFDAPQQAARVKGEVAPEPEKDYVLTAADAPKNVEKFDAGSGPDLTFREEEYSSPVVKLVEMTESADVAPVASTTAMEDLDEMDYVPAAKVEPTPTPAPAPEASSEPVPEPAPEPAPVAVPVPAAAPAPAAAPPVVPTPLPVQVPSVPTPAAINGAAVPVDDLDLDVATPATPAIPTPVSPAGIWPWPQAEPWDDSVVRKALRDTMESTKAGQLDDAKRSLIALGPHLGERVDLVFHIGVLLKRFGQEEVMRRMIETARIQHPNSPEVSKAVQHLLV
ncbi:MAG TPA: hypothetical protein EYQ80_03590 [Candidatus Poseidoniales archaeon]|nr:hypothetical protein [Candidatus Poseidoniales archaeon]